MLIVDGHDKEVLKVQDLIRMSQERTLKIKERMGISTP
jgi:hypothetical protein